MLHDSFAESGYFYGIRWAQNLTLEKESELTLMRESYSPKYLVINGSVDPYLRVKTDPQKRVRVDSNKRVQDSHFGDKHLTLFLESVDSNVLCVVSQMLVLVPCWSIIFTFKLYSPGRTMPCIFSNSLFLLHAKDFLLIFGSIMI